MPPETPQQRRRRLSVISGVTGNSYDFTHICKRKPDRVGIVAEGDSWFAYPRKWIAFGADINIVHHVSDKIHGTNKANLLRLASNGDEAVDMTSGKQFKKLYRTLKRNKEFVDILLFSAGGNDMVGKNDMLPLLNDYLPGMTFLDCVNSVRFEQKLQSILLAYERLVNLCADIIPQAQIITHTYDIAVPWDQGAEFFWGLIKTKPWVKPYLLRRGIPDSLHAPILEYMLTAFGNRLIALSQASPNNQRLRVVQTQGTLTPGSESDWLNEIHPTEEGFKRISQKIYAEMKTVAPSLP
ncbi:MAG: hypothetical protein V7682_07275 [Cycloclasticus sp.]